MKKESTSEKPKKHLLLRVLAILMAVVLAGELVLMSLTQVSFSPEDYTDSGDQRAAEMLAEREEYLRESALQRSAAYVRAQTAADKYESYSTKASVAIGQENYADAAGYIEECIHYYQGDSEEELAALYLKLGGLYILCDENDKALAALDEALSIEKENADALYLRIQLSIEKEDYETAAENALAYEKCGEMDNDTLKAFAGIYDAAGDTENAERVYTELLENAETKDVSYYASRGRIKVLEGDLEGAIEDLETFFLENGTDENGEAAILLCGCYLQEGAYEKAKAAYDSALENGANPSTQLKNWMAAACLSLEAYEDAEALLDEVLSEEPGYEGASYLKGLCLYAGESYEAAEEAFTASIDLSQEMMNSLYYRGLCRMLLGKHEEAEEDLTEVAEAENDLSSSAKELLEALKEE